MILADLLMFAFPMAQNAINDAQLWYKRDDA
jgi:hypothetical protein